MDDKIPTFKLILVGDSGTIINIILTIFFFFLFLNIYKVQENRFF